MSSKAGPSATRGGKKQRDPHTQQRIKSNALKRKGQDEELEKLRRDIAEFNPSTPITTFTQLPLSSRTLRGLRSSHFTTPTPIQATSIPISLQGQDVLGSARTGSGKTLAFLIPLLERLYLERWGPMDGLGAVVLSPTRELAIQTFNALRSIGGHHTFSAGLVIGGKSLKDEQDRLQRMNILIATPGRLLQHFDSTVGLDTSGVKVLVLDEADRLLDLGFLPTLRAIIQHITPGGGGPSTKSATQVDQTPKAPTTTTGRQTLLFSATQSPNLVQLAKLSLNSPVTIDVDQHLQQDGTSNADPNAASGQGSTSTSTLMPAGLEQFYAVVELDRKLDALWGFVKSHLKMKGVVFVSSCKQVRFIFETFRRLHPGLPLMHLHGKQKQPTRLDIFQRFSQSTVALLVCTDIASRGLDFPLVDWVIQLDCPEDVDMYIHRVGRTARYQSGGKGLTILCPSEEEGMKKRWEEKGLEVKRIRIKESKMGQLQQQMQNFAFRDPEIKYMGQRAFVSYMKSVHLQKDKSIFDLTQLPVEAFAASLGLPGAPQIKFIGQAHQKKNAARGKLQQEENDKVQGVKTNAAGEKETVTKTASGKVGTQVELADSESDESELGSGDEDEEDGSEDELQAGKADVDSESESESDASDDADTKDDVSTSKKDKQAVRTKYDRMFERKNQGVLAPHFSALVTHDGVVQDGDEDDGFLTLKERDHTLEAVGLGDDKNAGEGDAGNDVSKLTSEEMLSKRKLKQGESRKAMLKLKSSGHKVIFDDAGGAHEMYEMQNLDDFAKQGDAEAQRQEYLAVNREAMKQADVVDRQVAREKRQEKKRKRKDREREERLAELQGSDEDDDEEGAGGGFRVTLGRPSDASDSASDSDSNDDDGENEVSSRPTKRTKFDGGSKKNESKSGDVEDEEALALRLLQGSA